MRFIVWTFFIPSFCFANLTGLFVGTGRAVMHSSGKTRTCGEISLQMTQAPSSFRMLHGGYRCEDLSASYPDFTLEIRNGTLYSENVAVGAIHENSMTLSKVDKEDGSTFRLHLEKVPPNRLRYVEEWTENGRPALTVEGLLTGRNF